MASSVLPEWKGSLQTWIETKRLHALSTENEEAKRITP
jgi:hypothetical protein